MVVKNINHQTEPAWKTNPTLGTLLPLALAYSAGRGPDE
jgi:hypothetical protein